jgi:hypothetical protein
MYLAPLLADTLRLTGCLGSVKLSSSTTISLIIYNRHIDLVPFIRRFTMAWQRLIKFRDFQGQVHYGDPVIKDADELAEKLAAQELKAVVLDGSSIPNLHPTCNTVEVAELLGPLTPADVPTVKCVGLNYTKHSNCRY